MSVISAAAIGAAATKKRRNVTLAPTAGVMRLVGVAPTVTSGAVITTVEMGAVEWNVRYFVVDNVTLAPAAGIMRVLGVAPTVTGGTDLASVEIGAIEWNVQYIPVAASEATISGTLQAHHSIYVDVEGPAASYSQTDPATWRNYRYQVTFTKGATTIGPVPGLFFADGNPGNTGATSGKVWRCIFRPSEAGTWHYVVSFTTGTDVALVLPDTPSGTGLGMDGDEGDIVVAESTAFGDRSFFQPNLGRPSTAAMVAGTANYLQFERDTGRYFLFAGPGSPENLKADTDFTNTSRVGGGTLHGWAPHVTHWRAASGSRPADLTWVDGVRGKGIVGAMNYVASKGNNTVYSIIMNAGIVNGTIAGDGKDVYPYPAAGLSAPRDVFDCAKIHQWFMFYEWCNRRGIWPTLYLYEMENYGCLDGNTTDPTAGSFGPLSKLYIRTMVALLDSLYLGWNVAEETGGVGGINAGDIAYLQAFADYLHDTQAYANPIGAHNPVNEEAGTWDPMVNRASFHWVAHQSVSNQDVNAVATTWTGSAKSASPLLIYDMAEQQAPYDFALDSVDSAHTQHRQQKLYDSLMGRGSGVHGYSGGSYSGGATDHWLDNFALLSNGLDQYRWALQAWEYISFHQCAPDNSRIQAGAPAGTRCFRKTGECYLVYQRGAGTVSLSLSGETGTWRQDRINPLAATSLTNVSTSLTGGGNVSLGDPGAEMLTLVTKTGIAPTIRRIVLVNATTGVDIGPLYDGCVLDTDVVGTSLAFRAVTSPGVVGSVALAITGEVPSSHTENTAPYALPNQTSGAYVAWQSGSPVDGSYTITATPSTAADGGGTQGTPLALDFVVNTPSAAGNLLQYGGQTVEYGGEQVSY